MSKPVPVINVDCQIYIRGDALYIKQPPPGSLPCNSPARYTASFPAGVTIDLCSNCASRAWTVENDGQQQHDDHHSYMTAEQMTDHWSYRLQARQAAASL